MITKKLRVDFKDPITLFENGVSPVRPALISKINKAIEQKYKMQSSLLINHLPDLGEMSNNICLREAVMAKNV